MHIISTKRCYNEVMRFHLLKFFDKTEDKIRGRLSHRPIMYGIVGGVAMVLFWRGVWLTADQVPFLTGPVTLIISTVILLATGLLVSSFIGDSIIMSGVKQEKKLTEKTEKELESEIGTLDDIKKEIDRIEKTLVKIERSHHVGPGI